MSDEKRPVSDVSSSSPDGDVSSRKVDGDAPKKHAKLVITDCAIIGVKVVSGTRILAVFMLVSRVFMS